MRCKPDVSLLLVPCEGDRDDCCSAPLSTEGKAESPTKCNAVSSLLQLALKLQSRDKVRQAAAALHEAEQLGGPTVLQDDPRYEVIKWKAEQLETAFGTLSEPADGADSSWERVVDDGEALQAHWKEEHLPGGVPPAYHFRVEGLVNAPMLYIASMMFETELMPLWIPYFKRPLKLGLRTSQVLGRLAAIDMASLFKLDFPWPLANRDFAMLIFAADEYDEAGRALMRMADAAHPANTSVASHASSQAPSALGEEPAMPRPKTFVTAASTVTSHSSSTSRSPARSFDGAPDSPIPPIEHTKSAEAACNSVRVDPLEGSGPTSGGIGFSGSLESLLGTPLPPPEHGAMRMAVSGSIGMQVAGQPKAAASHGVDGSAAHLTMLWRLEAGIRLPHWFLSFVLRVVMRRVWHEFAKQARGFWARPEAAAAREKNPRYYAWLEETYRRHGWHPETHA